MTQFYTRGKKCFTCHSLVMLDFCFRCQQSYHVKMLLVLLKFLLKALVNTQHLLVNTLRLSEMRQVTVQRLFTIGAGTQKSSLVHTPKSDQLIRDLLVRVTVLLMTLNEISFVLTKRSRSEGRKDQRLLKPTYPFKLGFCKQSP